MEFFAFDDEYVRRLREGDRETEEHYFDYFNFHLAIKLRGRVPAADIDDIIQEVHSRLFKELRQGKGVRDSHKFGAFVFGICDNVVHETWRKQRNTQELKDIHFATIDVVRDLIQKQTKERVRSTVHEIEGESERDGAILRDVFLNEKDKDGVCRDWGVDRDYLRVLLHRALKKFRDKYGDPDGS